MKTRLRDLREDHDLTQQECADLAHISKKSYIRYENGERVPPLDVVAFFANFYNVSLDYITGLIQEPRKLYAESGSKTITISTKGNGNKYDIRQ